MNQKTLAIIIVAVIAVAVVAVAAYYLMNNGDDNVEDIITVKNASSLQFSVSITREGETYETMYWAKNIGTSDLMIRVEIPDTSGDLIYIVNGANQTAWASTAGEWMDLSDTFSDQSDMWSLTADGYKDELSTWVEGDWTYTDTTDGSTVRVYDIAVNPSLADSLFAP
ncbi:hypothetical protein JJE00_04875 [Candidatus Bathyarchaeota archaeon]|nr:hypothetical protein [Candidatus Bathyarchaeota archaeon]